MFQKIACFGNNVVLNVQIIKPIIGNFVKLNNKKYIFYIANKIKKLITLKKS